MVTRRKTLQAIGLGALATTAGIRLSSVAFAQAAENPLRIPTAEQGSLAGNTRSFQLELRQGSSVFLPDTTTATLGINGDYLGPTLRFRRNEQVSLQITNQIGEPSTLHWHGFHIPTTEDGGPHQVIENSDTWNPQFTVVQFAGTFWYHSHMLNTAGEQVYRGLAGMIIVDDDEQQLELPSSYGIDDIPLVVQDRRFNSDGSFSYMNQYEDLVMGMHGESILVNGTYQPYFNPSTRLVRFRILNAANARTFNFAFE